MLFNNHEMTALITQLANKIFFYALILNVIKIKKINEHALS